MRSPDAVVLKLPQANTYTTTSISDYIKQNFSADTDRIRAVYVWINNNIGYDAARLPARKPGKVSKQCSTGKKICCHLHKHQSNIKAANVWQE